MKKKEFAMRLFFFKNIYKMLAKIYKIRRKYERRVLFFTFINTILRVLLFVWRQIIKVAKIVLLSSLKRKLFPIVKKILGYPPQARHYIKKNLDIETFFKTLNYRNVNYVVLRWFENLPHVDHGEDLDILIADQDIDRISDLVTIINNRNQAIDLYSVSGVNGSSYNGASYYPPHLAMSILTSRKYHKNLYAVPDERHYFLSLAYHAVFHKVQNSGLAFVPECPSIKADHDYPLVLEKLALKAGVKLNDINFIKLFEFLKIEKWVPPLDTFRILAMNNIWLHKLLDLYKKKPCSEPEDIMVFIIRHWALENKKIDFIVNKICDARLDLIKIHILSDNQKVLARTYIRGGKWDKGPYPVSGGEPAAIIIVFDYSPQKPSPLVLKKFPFISNQNLTLKYDIRDAINSEMPLWRHTNCIHSANDAAEAWDYIEITIPNQKKNILEEIKKRRLVFSKKYPILETYNNNGTRAKTEKIDYNGQLAVLKTFKIGCERFAEREAFAYETFSKIIDTVPPLLECGSNYIIIPWYNNVLPNLSGWKKRNIIKKHTIDIIRTMRCFYDNNYAIIGFYPGNLIITSEGDLKIIDFEFLYQYKEKPNRFDLCYDWAGVPLGFDGDLPRGTTGKSHTFQNTWKNYMHLRDISLDKLDL